jgi:alpha-glucosidase
MTDQTDTDLFTRLRFPGEPVADPRSVVVHGCARFTVLSPRLLRLEWSAGGQIEDRGTYAFPTRRAPVPAYTSRVEGDRLILSTSALELTYHRSDGPFTPENLSIVYRFDGTTGCWAPGQVDPLNLRGTRRTLDNCAGDVALEPGLLSRSGWFLFDDSRSVVFNREDGWVAPRPAEPLQDWYFGCYGHDYRGALGEYLRFGGSVPLIPRFVLGAWWSRYWAYSAQDLEDLVHDFETRDLPLDVLVVDMDWHTPHAWTGYTWNRQLFPDPEGFLRRIHAKGLRVTFNLHPAQGVGPFEEVYPRFAAAMGVDPDGGQAVPFRITDKRFVKNYFELLHHPMEAQGVDFWWIDWQQGEVTEIPGLDALPWLNHLHFQDSKRHGTRAMLYSRWGGLGNHRYHIGFSGDTIVGWPALQFQPYFTATAANVAYGWWSHDIGGHMGGATEPELYARWVQFGALSPALRLHSTKDARCERRPWAYPEPACTAAAAAFHLRYRLIPYIYTYARVAADTGIALCRPMYYDYPEEEAAYLARYQYFFGVNIIAAPIVFPADPASGLASTDVWVPEGTWIDYQTRETYTGPRWVRLVGDLLRVPMLVKAGAIIPLSAPFAPPDGAPFADARLASGTTDALPQDRLVLSIYPGVGTFRLYEDDGISEGYRAGECEWTGIAAALDGDAWQVTIAPAQGACPAMPAERSYEIRLEASRAPLKVLVDGVETSAWRYDPESLVTVIDVPPRDRRRATTVLALDSGRLSALGPERNRACAVADVRRLLGLPADAATPADPDGWLAALPADTPAVVSATDTPAAVANAIARLGGPFVRVIEFTAPDEAAQCYGRVIVGGPAAAGEPYEVEATFTLWQGGERTIRTVRRPAPGGAWAPSLAIDMPFAFDGRAVPTRWQAEVCLTWRGWRIVSTHRSALLFATVHFWRALYYNPHAAPMDLAQVVDDAAVPEPSLPWQARRAEPERSANLRRPFGVMCAQDCRDALEAGEPVAGYLATTVISPDEREAVLYFQAEGELAFFLNGRPLAGEPQEPEGMDADFPVDHFARGPRALRSLHLQAGRNTLVISTRPDPAKGPGQWYFGGAFATPAGAPMPDLVVSE